MRELDKDPNGDLWKISIKLRGMADLFSKAGPEPPLDEEPLKGISYILLEMAEELTSLHDDFYLEKRKDPVEDEGNDDAQDTGR